MITKTEEEAINNILDACKLLDWNIKVEVTNEDKDLLGLVIGKDEYLDRVKFDDK